MILKEIRNRCSIREYAADPISDDQVRELLRAAKFAPTSRNNRAIEFVVVHDQSMKEQLYDIAVAPQEFVRDAPVLIVPVTDPSKTNQPVQDLSIASMAIFLQAASMDLGTVWKNLAPEVATKVKQTLGIPEALMVINLIPVGHPTEKPGAHIDDELDDSIVHLEKW